MKNDKIRNGAGTASGWASNGFGGGTASGYGGAGIQLLTQIGQSGSIFTTEDAYRLAGEIGIAPSYVNRLLALLAESGLLQRLKRGMYAITAWLPGMQDLPPFALSMKLFPGCAISGWSALHYHELTEQIPRSITVTTPKLVQTPSMRGKSTLPSSRRQVGVHVFEISTVTHGHFFGFQNVWMGEEQVRIFEKERAVLDCFALPRKFGGLSTGLGLLEEHLHRLDIGKLVQHALTYDSFAACKRLGWSLEQAGAPKIQYAPLLGHKGEGYRLLDPTSADLGPYEPRWQIRNNLDLERIK